MARKLFEKEELNTDESHVIFDTFLTIKTTIVEDIQKKYSQEPKYEDNIAEITPVGETRIRYLGGRSIYKNTVNTRKQLYTSIRQDNPSDHLKQQLELFSKLRITETEVMETTESGYTLSYIQKRQRPGCSLTHVSDETHRFFLQLEKIRRQNTTINDLCKQKGNILEHVKTKCLENNELKDQFVKTIGGDEDNKEASQEVFSSLVVHYLRPPQNDYRKTLSIKLGKTRKLKHRVTVLTEDSLKNANTEVLDSEKCGACNGHPRATPASICWLLCDNCEQWFHAGCTGISNDTELQQVKQLDTWYCPTCVLLTLPCV